jgi:hypothetical protein
MRRALLSRLTRILPSTGSLRRRSRRKPRRRLIPRWCLLRQTLDAPLRIPTRAVTPQLRQMMKRLMSRNHLASFPQPQSELPAPAPCSHRHPASVPEAAVAAPGRIGTNLQHRSRRALHAPSDVRRHPLRGGGGGSIHEMRRDFEGVLVRETRREGVRASVLVTGREDRRAVLPRCSGLCGQRRGREARDGASCCCGRAIRHPRRHCRRLLHLQEHRAGAPTKNPQLRVRLRRAVYIGREVVRRRISWLPSSS